MLSYEEGIDVILAHSTAGESVLDLPIEGAMGFVLAADVRADLDAPAFNRAAMDGFAFRHADASAGVRFRIGAVIAAGDSPSIQLAAGECVKIMTGAPVPEGADTIIPVEDTSAYGGAGKASFTADSEPGDFVQFHSVPPRDSHIAPRGQDVHRGQTVLRTGDLIRAQEIAILAALGQRNARVFGGPAIAFCATGDEIVEPGESLRPGQVRNSNAYTLWSQILAARAEPHYLGIAPDRGAGLHEKIRAGLDRDILIISGGISEGEFDLVPQALIEAGVEIRFRKLRVRPGRPVLFGTRGRTLVFGLPGNPISTLIAFDQYVLPAVRVFRHHPRPRGAVLAGRLERSIASPAGWLTFVACTSEWRDGGYHLEPHLTHGSADIFAISQADAIALIPADVTVVAAGETVAFRKLYED